VSTSEVLVDTILHRRRAVSRRDGWPLTKQPPEVLAYLRGRAQADLETLDTFLASSEFLLPSGLTVADISCSAYLFWLSQAGLAEADYPNVQRWLSVLRGIPGWRHPDEALEPEAHLKQ
jgi:glutathione S-transferase